MAWDHLSINKPHLVYIILGGFTSIFMLCSSIIKERLYIGEATVATICGIIFGPHAANLINPGSWGNVDQITLEFSRVVLVVQCFAVGVELPKAYMEKHWRSVVFLLVPVMTFGWLVTSLFIWAVFHDQMNWLDSLVCAACVTATDPVLASSVVGKGKFAKRVPKHLRDLLSAESGCNDGMAFPFIYLGIYLVRYRPDADQVSFHWFCFTILYECIFGAIYGVLIGYIARRAIRFAHERDLIDRESFLVFYFVLALFCAGSGSLLGTDDLLVGFACGVGFSNDGWFQEKTEESHVSNVIDLLINLAFFVYFGTIIPWSLYSSELIGVTPWKLVVIALLVLFFRRIPIMLLLKPVIPDIKTWREALFAGHFGPIGVGALFVAILARAEFETDTTTPLAELPKPGFPHRNIIELIWPITTFLVMTSIIIHGSSVAVFTLGRHINTLSFTMSYTQANEANSWMDRLPRISSRSKSQMSLPKTTGSSQEDLEKALAYPAATLPRNFLRRIKDEDNPSRPSSIRPSSRKKRWDFGIGPGGHVEQSAIVPQSSWKLDSPMESSPEKVDSDTTAVSSDHSSPVTEKDPGEIPEGSHVHSEAKVFQEGDKDIVEDEDGEVLDIVQSPDAYTEEQERENEANLRQEVTQIMRRQKAGDEAATGDRPKPEERLKEDARKVEGEVKNLTQRKQTGQNSMRRKLSGWGGTLFPSAGQASQESKQPAESPSQVQAQRKQVPARAFKIGNSVIVEDEDGEVIKKYDLPQKTKPRTERNSSYVDSEKTKQRMQRVGKWMGVAPQEAGEDATEEEVSGGRRKSAVQDNDDEDRIRFTIQGTTRRMSKADFFKQIQSMNPHSSGELVEDSDASEPVKREARAIAGDNKASQRSTDPQIGVLSDKNQTLEGGEAEDVEQSAESGRELRKLDSATDQAIPVHAVAEDVRRHSVFSGKETPAERRRRTTMQSQRQGTLIVEEGSDDEETERNLYRGRSDTTATADSQSSRGKLTAIRSSRDQEETAAERRRREGALGVSKEDSDDEEDKPMARQQSRTATASDKDRAAVTAPPQSTGSSSGIRFADQDNKPRFGSVRWGLDKGR